MLPSSHIPCYSCPRRHLLMNYYIWLRNAIYNIGTMSPSLFLYIGKCYPRGIFLNPDVALAIPRARRCGTYRLELIYWNWKYPLAISIFYNANKTFRRNDTIEDNALIDRPPKMKYWRNGNLKSCDFTSTKIRIWIRDLYYLWA